MRARFITFSRLPFWFYNNLIMCIHTCMVVDRCNKKHNKLTNRICQKQTRSNLSFWWTAISGAEGERAWIWMHFISLAFYALPRPYSIEVLWNTFQYFAILYYTLQYSPPTALRNCNPDKYSQYAAPGKLKRRGFDTNKWFKDEDETNFWRQVPSLKSWIT